MKLSTYFFVFYFYLCNPAVMQLAAASLLKFQSLKRTKHPLYFLLQQAPGHGKRPLSEVRQQAPPERPLLSPQALHLRLHRHGKERRFRARLRRQQWQGYELTGIAPVFLSSGTDAAGASADASSRNDSAASSRADGQP